MVRFLAALIFGLCAAVQPATAQSLFADAIEQRLFILKESIEENPGASERIDVQVYAIIVNACRDCAETYVFVETQLHRGRALGSFECNYRFKPLKTFSNGLKDFECAREAEGGTVTRYHLKFDGARYQRQNIAQ